MSNMRALIGTRRQVAWAERIIADLTEEYPGAPLPPVTSAPWLIERRRLTLSELWQAFETSPPDALDGSPFVQSYPRIGRDATLATLDGLARLDGRYLVYDSETTGVQRGTGPKGSEVIEIGVCSAEGRPLCDSYVRPVQLTDYAGSEAERANGVPAGVLARMPSLADVWPALAVVLTSAPVVIAWNAPFDAEMLARSLRRYGVPAPRLRWLCAMRTAAALWEMVDWPSLDLAAETVGAMPERYGARHTALADARLAAAVVRHMLKEGNP